MIHWAWLILAYFVGGIVGVAIMSLLKNAAEGDRHG